MRLLDILTSPWAIEPQKLLEIRAIYETHLRGDKIDIAAVEARLGMPLANEEQGYTLDHNVAVVPVDGVIARRANMFTRVSGGASTELIARDIHAALEDPAAEYILLYSNTPGGTVDGVQELSHLVLAAREQKPIIALCENMMASGGYWIGSAANQIYVSCETDQIGSIGVVTTHVDVSKAEEQYGRKTTEITAGKYKRISSSYAPLSEEGRGDLQAKVDALYTIFVNDVARQRGVAVEKVLTDMADGRVFLGREAIDRGLADGLSTYDALIADLSAGRIQTKRRIQVPGAGIESSAPSTTTTEVNNMDIKTLREKHPEVATALIEEGHKAGVAAGIAQGAEAERTRIQEVASHSMPGHRKLVKSLMFDGKTTGAEAAVQVLQAERKIRKGALAGLTADAPDSVPVSVVAPVKPGAPPAASEADAIKAAWDKDAKVREEFGTFDTYAAFAKAQAKGQVKVLGKSA